MKDQFSRRDEPALEPQTITISPGTNGAGSLYEDDGENFDFQKGEFMRIEMQWDDRARKLAIRLAPGARMQGANPRTLSVMAIDSNQTRTVVFHGDPLSVAL